MPLVPADYEVRVRAAVTHYWKTLEAQSSRQRAGDADRGGRSAVTGGKHMDGFCELIRWLLQANGLAEEDILFRTALELPGYFRPTKRWDMLVLHDGHLVAGIEFKSQRGPSFGNNYNNRSEESLGTATDLWTAYREGAFGAQAARPWLGWFMLLEHCPDSTAPVEVREPHFPVFPEFVDISYAKRYELLFRKLLHEKLYDGAAFLMATENDRRAGRYIEPAVDLSIKKFLAGLAGHVRSYVEGV